jgi:hypothetical protein
MALNLLKAENIGVPDVRKALLTALPHALAIAAPQGNAQELVGLPDRLHHSGNICHHSGNICHHSGNI